MGPVRTPNSATLAGVPEGDTIHRTAARLHGALGGARVERAESRARRVAALGAGRLVGQTVDEVESRGKHLLTWFAPSGLALHTHLGMHGAWHVYRPGRRWRKPPERAAIVLGVADWIAVCFAPPVCELLTGPQIAAHPTLAALGPDALAGPELGGTDLAEARRRLDARTEWTVAAALLDQRVLAGVGNVFKCEVLFACGVDPWARVADLDGSTRDALLATSEQLLRANAAPGVVRRTTGPDPVSPASAGSRLAVYGRARQPCPRCHAPVRVSRQGDQGRVTYWCSRCQGPKPGVGEAAEHPGQGEPPDDGARDVGGRGRSGARRRVIG